MISKLKPLHSSAFPYGVAPGSFQLFYHVASYVHAVRDELELLGESLQQPPQEDKGAPAAEEVSLITKQVSGSQLLLW